MITKDRALKLRHGDILHAGDCSFTVGPRGGTSLIIVQWRVSGQVKTWKRSPERFRFPVKHGLYDNGEVTESKNADYMHFPDDCPALKAESEHRSKS
jgi:hypothetical protein